MTEAPRGNRRSTSASARSNRFSIFSWRKRLIESNEDGPYSITEDELRARLEKKNVGRIRTQLFGGFIACLGNVTFGTALGWSCPATYELEDTHDEIINSREFVWIASITCLGATIGIISWTYIMKQVGPRKAMLIQAPLFILTWYLTLLRSVEIAGRYFLGFLGICYVICGETLMNQTIHQDLKKYIHPVFNAAMITGVQITQIISSEASMSNLNVTIVCSIFPILHFILLYIAPESPVFLYNRSHTAAEKSLTWYRGQGNIFMDMRAIRKDHEAQRVDPENYKYMLFSKVVYKGLLIVLFLTICQVSSGYFIFLLFNVDIWNNGNVIFSHEIDAVIFGLYFFTSKLFWGVVHNNKFIIWDIRKTLIVSCLIGAMFLSAFSIYLYLDYHKVLYVRHLFWLPLLFVGLMIFFYDMGLNYYTSVLIFEYMPHQVFRMAYAIIQIWFWLFVFFNIFSFANLISIVQIHYTFTALSCVLYIGALFCYFFVVEPTGKSLMQIQVEIGGNPIGHRGGVHMRKRDESII